MSGHVLQSFIELVSFDQATYALEDKIQQTEKEIELLEKTAHDLSSGSTVVASRLKEARKEVDHVELTMKTLELQEQEEKQRLEKVTNKKEYQSIVKEIDTLKRQQHDYEKTLLVAWNKFETLKKEHEARHADDEKRSAELTFDMKQKQEALAALQQELEQRLQEREAKKALVPTEWLEKYILMRSRVADPVVPVVNGSCTACFYNLPPQEFLSLTKNAMIQCKGCYRFLYIATPQE